jgi:hypothetical protein
MGAWRAALAGQPSKLREEVEQKIAPTKERWPADGDSVTAVFRQMQADYSPGLGDLPWFSKHGIKNRLRRIAGTLHNAALPRRRPVSAGKFRTPLEAADWLERLEKWEQRTR